MRRSFVFSGLVLAIAASAFACSTDPPAATPNDGGTPAVDAAPPAPPYSVTALDRARITSISSDPNFQKVRGDITLQPGTNARVMLVVDLDTTCFPFAKWADDPPPAGQNWPPSCDAFDRNFEISLIDPAAPSAPAIELVHAITPFGGPLHIEEDVTDIFAVAPGKRAIAIEIPTYSDSEGQVSGSKGGWFVSARLDVTPGDKPRDVAAVIPLHYGSVTEGGVAKTFAFTLPEGTTSARIDYVATGHGGGTDRACLGPADEFCERIHTLTLDGAKLAEIDMWRDDCDKLCTTTPGGPGGRSYCKENPCGAAQSVRAPRANWCPGSVSPMKSYDLASATPGAHTFAFTIDAIASGGSWRGSARVVAYR